MAINPKQDITLKTIAKMANVSHTTVSRALNGSALVKPETKQKITEIAQKMGYVPNLNAKGLVTRRSFLVGVFFSDLSTGTSESFLTDVVSQARATLPKDYDFSINSTQNATKSHSLLMHNYDGIIVLSQSTIDDTFIDQAVTQGFPIVVLNRSIQREDISNYSINDFVGSKNIMDYAIRMGHKDFGLIQGPDFFESVTQRTNGFLAALKDNGLEVDPDLIKKGDYRPKSGNVAMRQILTSGNIPTCVFCENDDMAVGAINACKELGFRVPEDVSFIGYDDMAYAKYLVPGLTTVRKPTDVIIKMGMEELMALLDHNTADKPVQKKVISPEIIVRNSVIDRRKKD